MEGIFLPEFRWLWSVALAVALFFPVRQLIWVLAVRRAQRRADGRLPDGDVQGNLKSRAGVTAALLCLIFASVYAGVMLGDGR